MPLFTPTMIETNKRLTGGVPVVFGDVSTYGHLHEVDADVVRQQWGTVVTGRVRELRIAWAMGASLELDQALTIDGGPYTVRKAPLKDIDDAVVLVTPVEEE